MNSRAICGIADLSGRYEVEFLAAWAEKRGQYRTDWFAALEFFLGHVFFQGRRDTLSDRYCKQTVVVLRDFFSDDQDSQAKQFDHAWNRRWIPHDPAWSDHVESGNVLLQALTEAKAGKQRDREMVLDALRYVRGLPHWNLVSFSIDQIAGGKIGHHYEDLQQIRQVGPKTASFYLRDLCTVYGLEADGVAFRATQPIDTWVRAISTELRIIAREDSDGVARTKILTACEAAEVSPADYNAGAWYLGTHSLQLALEALGLERPSL